jgi:Domain of unknown function (DUF4400)
MLRAVAVLSLMALLILVLYMPSAHPPEHFLARLRDEHAAAAEFWGPAVATQLLDRAIRMQGAARDASLIPGSTKSADAPATAAVQAAVAVELSSVNQRLFNNAYSRSVDALLMLASHRLAAVVAWLPWLVVFLLAATIDGALVRVIKAREFRQHDPEMFALYAGLAIAVACASVLALVLPTSLHPLILPCAPVLIVVLLTQALGCFHRRG